MLNKSVKNNNESGRGEIPPIKSVGSSEILPIPGSEKLERGVNERIAEQIKKGAENIEKGKVPAVDPSIMQAARSAAAAENGGMNSQANLQYLLDILHGGSVGDPSSAVEDVLNASTPNNSGVQES